jgi:L-lactate dehydrogenase complex protein LldG
VHASNRTNPFVNRQPLKTGGKTPFMERIRKALGHAPGHVPTEAPPVHDDSVRQVAADTSREALVTRFMERAKANTMLVQKVAGDAGAVAVALDTCFANHKVTRSILNARELETPLNLQAYLQGRNIQVVNWGIPNSKDEAFTCEASVTDCQCAMADSGSLLVWSDATFGRSSTLVVPVHIILLPASRIVPDMIDALQFTHQEARASGVQGHLPSNIVIINGPSKTADIEMNLVTGVHGPKFLHVLVLENL